MKIKLDTKTDAELGQMNDAIYEEQQKRRRKQYIASRKKTLKDRYFKRTGQSDYFAIREQHPKNLDVVIGTRIRIAMDIEQEARWMVIEAKPNDTLDYEAISRLYAPITKDEFDDAVKRATVHVAGMVS